MLNKALHEFNEFAQISEESGKLTGSSLIKQIESRDECIGRDG